MAITQEQPDFFVRGPSPFARLTFFGLLALFLMFVDARYRYLEVVRKGVATVIYPVQQAALWPAMAWQSTANFFQSRKQLQSDNEALKKAELQHAQILQAHKSVSLENERLRGLLGIAPQLNLSSQAASVLYKGRDAFSQKIFIDQGLDKGVAAGQVVIDARGLVGQLTRIYPLLSEVTLITEKDHVVPVQIERTGLRTVLFGRGAGKQPELRYLNQSVDVREGDVLVTSGLDGVYPAKLAVAQVSQIKREPNAAYAQIICAPLAGIETSNSLLVLAPATPLPSLPSLDQQSTTPKAKGRRV